MVNYRTDYAIAREDVLVRVRRGATTPRQMASGLPHSEKLIRHVLQQLVEENKVVLIGRGQYALTSDPKEGARAGRRFVAPDYSPIGKQFNLVRTGDMSTPPMRPGAMDYAAIPSRRGNKLYYRDGRIETIGATA
ncbi:hypothetical protein [Brachymonas sp.]|uniref:hypothetical protein n=1 Tax=Brachymonas sp. TaxID=1936292 RepID=UPI0035AF6B78